jgi:hypothetical protein
MVNLQRKLTLKDASKLAYEKGEALIGREKELSDLLTFFRAAIRGDPGVGGVKSSLICAGPPGGKLPVTKYLCCDTSHLLHVSFLLLLLLMV